MEAVPRGQPVPDEEEVQGWTLNILEPVEEVALPKGLLSHQVRKPEGQVQVP